jgi:hypothetical protein
LKKIDHVKQVAFRTPGKEKSVIGDQYVHFIRSVSGPRKPAWPVTIERRSRH